MVRVCISVEGLTEERFVTQLLVPHYAEKGIFVYPTSIGGKVSIPRIKGELERLAHNHDYVTTLYDFYGFLYFLLIKMLFVFFYMFDH